MGGIARANTMTKEERQASARLAAVNRWHGDLPRATHDGELQIGDMIIPCAVLHNGVRVLTQRGMLSALGRSEKASGKKDKKQETDEGAAQLPPFLASKSIKPFVSSDLAATSTPIVFIMKNGTKAFGYRAETLPAVCDVFLAAREAGALAPNQHGIAKKCELLVRSLAKVGIVALVDEATGYQEVRDKFALQAILDKYLRKELAAWAKQFPDEFYQQIFRLRRWEWKGMRVNRPQCVANYTKDIVYERLAPGILEELERKNPVENGTRRARHHQWLTADVGHPALSQHLHSTVTLMRAADSWEQFKKMLDRSLPKRGDTLLLPMDLDRMA